MADVIALPGAASEPVVNPKRRGGTPPRNVTRKAQLSSLRHRRAEERERSKPPAAADARRQYDHRELTDTLQWLLKEAEAGRRFELIGWMRDSDGHELCIRTGAYRTRTDEAMRDAMKISRHVYMAEEKS